MNYTITEEQIKDIAQGGGKSKIKEMFPEVFEPKLEVGKWYKVDGDKCGKSGRKLLACFSGTEEDSNYGFCFMGTWNNDLSLYHKDINKITFAATNEEVEAALIAEAKKRGFMEGVKFNCPYSRETETLGSRLDYELTGFDQEKLGMCLRDERGTVIYYKGIWSEIIKEKSLSKSEAEELITTLKNDGHEYKIV